MPLIQLIYQSSVTNQFNESQLASILASAVKNNAVNEITGILLYREGRFMQVLEGGTSQVNDLMWRIKEDPRNESVNVLGIQAMNRRDFPKWNMGFHQVSDSDLAANPHVVDFFSPSFNSYKADINYGAALIELMAFANKIEL